MNFSIKNATIQEADDIKILINEAYKVEEDEEFGFKKTPRLLKSLDPNLEAAYLESRVIKIVISDSDELVGVVIWKIQNNDSISFGPLAVRPKFQDLGAAKILIAEVEKIGKYHGLNYISLEVVNLRTELIKFYQKLGFSKYGEVAFPRPDLLTKPCFSYVFRKNLYQENTEKLLPSEYFEKKFNEMKNQKLKEYSGDESSPWKSLNQMLIENRCWLCGVIFPKGKQKKVFQVSNLVEFFRSLSQNNSVGRLENLTMVSENLRNCFQDYLQFTSEEYQKSETYFLSRLNELDIDLWMSGLVCDSNDDCIKESSYFIPKISNEKEKIEKNTNSKEKKTRNKKNHYKNMFTFANRKCGPDCDCDNPWPFIEKKN